MTDIATVYLELAKMIGEASETIKICTPSSDYYSNRGDWSEDKIKIINPDTLIQLLETAASNITNNQGK